MSSKSEPLQNLESLTYVTNTIYRLGYSVPTFMERTGCQFQPVRRNVIPPVPLLPSADLGPTRMVPEHPGHFRATTQLSPLPRAGCFFHLSTFLKVVQSCTTVRLGN